jgi:hypothetical protein
VTDAGDMVAQGRAWLGSGPGSGSGLVRAS